MDRLLAMEMFVRVVEMGSFSKAAREFNTTQPTVTKQIAATEERLKVRLLNRNTRGVSLTESGSLYYEKCKSIVHEAEEAEQPMGAFRSELDPEPPVLGHAGNLSGRPPLRVSRWSGA